MSFWGATTSPICTCARRGTTATSAGSSATETCSGAVVPASRRACGHQFGRVLELLSFNRETVIGSRPEAYLGQAKARYRPIICPSSYLYPLSQTDLHLTGGR